MLSKPIFANPISIILDQVLFSRVIFLKYTYKNISKHLVFKVTWELIDNCQVEKDIKNIFIIFNYLLFI